MDLKKNIHYSLFPYYVSMLFASIGVILNYNQNEKGSYTMQFILWLFLTLMLITLWFINLKIKHLSTYKLIIVNFFIVIITTLVFKRFILLQMNFDNFYILPFRLFVVSMFFLFFQKSQEIQLRNKTIELENVQLKSEKFSAELDHLKRQIDPHFLFNSLTVLHTLIRKDSSIAEEYLYNLSNLYRNILKNYTENTVSLEEELGLVKAYLHLQKTRFEDALQINIQIEENILNCQIPMFSLQLLLENCIKHNIVSDENPLYIMVFQKESALLCIKNNWQPKIKTEDSTGKGLANLKRRYELLGIRDGLSIDQNQQFYAVTIKIL